MVPHNLQAILEEMKEDLTSLQSQCNHLRQCVWSLSSAVAFGTLVFGVMAVQLASKASEDSTRTLRIMDLIDSVSRSATATAVEVSSIRRAISAESSGDADTPVRTPEPTVTPVSR